MASILCVLTALLIIFETDPASCDRAILGVMIFISFIYITIEVTPCRELLIQITSEIETNKVIEKVEKQAQEAQKIAKVIKTTSEDLRVV